MKKIIPLLLLSALFLASCSKYVDRPAGLDVNYFMQTHERGQIVYLDAYSGYFIVETNKGYAVARELGGTPYNYDVLYSSFSNFGVMDAYNRTGNYMTQINVKDNWMSYSEALYLLDQLSH